MLYAVINGGIVSGVYVWDGETTWNPVAEEIIKLDEGVSAGPGWAYADGVFTAPVVVEDEEV